MLANLLAVIANISNQFLFTVIAPKMYRPIARKQRILFHIWNRHLRRRPLRNTEGRLGGFFNAEVVVIVLELFLGVVIV